MKDNRFFQKHHTRLVVEGIIKSTLVGLIIGFIANFLAAFVSWFFEFGGIWLPIVVGVVAGIASGIIFYFKKFRPQARDIAGRVDRLGLEERLITMLEYEKDDSIMAQRQRRDAKEHMNDVSNKKVKFRLSKLMICFAVAAVLIGSSMTVVAGLADHGVIPPGTEIINPENKEYIAVSYVVEEGGEIIGEADQLILPGQDAAPVVAVANDGWVFFAWDDGYERPDRHDIKVTAPIEVIAVFVEITEDGEEDGGDNSDVPTEGDAASDVPADSGGPTNGNSGSDNSGGEQGNIDGGDGPGSDGDNENSENQGQGDGQGFGAGGKWDDSNQFFDGNTYYKDFLEQYYEMAMQYFEENGEIPPELREFFETYYGSL